MGGKKKLKPKSIEERTQLAEKQSMDEGVEHSESMDVQGVSNASTMCADGYIALDDLINSPEFSTFQAKPEFRVLNKEARQYALVNCLDVDGPSIIFNHEDPENNPAMIGFSCFVKHFGLIPPYYWTQVNSPGIAKLKFDRETQDYEKAQFEILLQHRPDGKTFLTADPRHYELIGKTDAEGCTYEMKQSEAKLDPDHVLMDKFTLALLDRSSWTFKTRDEETYRISHIMLQDVVSGGKRSADSESVSEKNEIHDMIEFRKEALRRANEDISINQNKMTNFYKNELKII